MTVQSPSTRRPPIGKAYGRLTILSYASRTEHGHHLWQLQCECGRVVTMYAGNVVGGKSTQCKWCGWASTRRQNLERARGLAINSARDTIFAQLFREGEKIDDIAARYCVGRGAVSAAIDRLRKKGIPVERAQIFLSGRSVSR